MDKHLAIALCCFCRQAERSIDRVNGVPISCSYNPAWNGLVNYYDDTRRAGLDWALDQLKLLGAEQPHAADRREVYQGTFLEWLFSLLNRRFSVRRHFWFAGRELAFLHSVIARFVEYLHANELPPQADLINLRMDFWTCQAIIRLRVGWLSELKKADAIEHFWHSDHPQHYSLEECGVFPAMMQH